MIILERVKKRSKYLTFTLMVKVVGCLARIYCAFWSNKYVSVTLKKQREKKKKSHPLLSPSLTVPDGRLLCGLFIQLFTICHNVMMLDNTRQILGYGGLRLTGILRNRIV